MLKTFIAAIVVAGASCGVGCVQPNPDARTSKLAAAEVAARKGGGKSRGGSNSNPEGIGTVIGRTADHPSLSGNPMLAGGLITRLPFSSNGSSVSINGPLVGQTGTWSTPPGYTNREVAVYIQYEPLLATGTWGGPDLEPYQGQEVKRGPSTTVFNRRQGSGTVVIPIEAPRMAVVLQKVMFDAVDRAGSVDLFSMLKETRRQSSLHHKLEATFEDGPHWWILSPGWTLGASGLDPSVVFAELYSSDPDGGAAPQDVAVVARRLGPGPWQSASGYLMRGERLMRATAVLENGLPVRVECVDVSEPPVEDFLVSKEESIQSGRLRTGVLLAAKNRTLPKILREGTNSSLTDLMTRIEKTILDLNHEREMVNNVAQQAIESGGSAGGLPELSLVYKERMEILKPMTAAIRDEIANRGK